MQQNCVKMKEDIDEKLREAACYGDWEAIGRMIANDKDIEINSQNKVNGWTALHWAAKRKHIKVVKVKKNRKTWFTIKLHSSELISF